MFRQEQAAHFSTPTELNDAFGNIRRMCELGELRSRIERRTSGAPFRQEQAPHFSTPAELNNAFGNVIRMCELGKLRSRIKRRSQWRQFENGPCWNAAVHVRFRKASRAYEPGELQRQITRRGFGLPD